MAASPITMRNSLILALGLALAGWFVGDGFRKSRLPERYVTVKGISEREVTADLALWPIRFVATSDVLSEAQARIQASQETILAFLAQQGIPRAAVEVNRLEVNDLLANPYRSGPVESRYIITQTLMVRTAQPETIAQASQDVGQLVKAGVVLSSEGGWGRGPTYLFTRLNELKPPMIAEATANAREAAQQFAADSQSRLGAIRRANQGVFVILPRDQAPGVEESGQMYKTVRVVSTIEYDLVH